VGHVPLFLWLLTEKRNGSGGPLDTELAGWRGFRECARRRVSVPGISGNVEGGGFLDN
jgi:hypothetical protein